MKRSVAVLLSALMVLSLAGCTEKETTKKTKKSKKTTKTEDTEDTEETDKPVESTEKPTETTTEETDETTDTSDPSQKTQVPTGSEADPWETIPNNTGSSIYQWSAEDLIEWAIWDSDAVEANDAQKAAFLNPKFSPADKAFETGAYFTPTDLDLKALKLDIDAISEDTLTNAAVFCKSDSTANAYLFAFVLEAKDTASAQAIYDEILKGGLDIDRDELQKKAEESDIQYGFLEEDDEFGMIVISEEDYNMASSMYFSITEDVVVGCTYVGPYDETLYDEYYDLSYDAFYFDVDELLDDFNHPAPVKPDTTYSVTFDDRSNSVISAAKSACGAKEANDEQKTSFEEDFMDGTEELFSEGAYYTFPQDKLKDTDWGFDDLDPDDIKNATAFCKCKGNSSIQVLVMEIGDEDQAWDVFCEMTEDSLMFDEEDLKEMAGESDLKYAYSMTDDEFLLFLVSEKDYKTALGMYVKYEGTILTACVFNGDSDMEYVKEFYTFMKDAGLSDIESQMK
ncbi:MAG: hypothetical protein J5379_08870 [Clostridiales bacterium]|nr:hypothetical protein [Clostridiales bacterium]